MKRVALLGATGSIGKQALEIIGADPELDGFIWVGALGGHGMTTSYAVGRLGAQAVMGDTSPQLDYFSPRRLIDQAQPE